MCFVSFDFNVFKRQIRTFLLSSKVREGEFDPVVKSRELGCTQLLSIKLTTMFDFLQRHSHVSPYLTSLSKLNTNNDFDIQGDHFILRLQQHPLTNEIISLIGERVPIDPASIRVAR